MKMRRVLPGLFLLSLFSLPAMSWPTCTGSRCTARVSIKARQGAFNFEGASFSSTTTSPRDASSGMASGKRQHQMIVITKLFDAASPKLYRALKENEVLPEVTIELTREEKGKPVVYYTVTLQNAVVTAIHSEAAGHGQRETVEFTSERMEMKAAPGRTMAVDSWSEK